MSTPDGYYAAAMKQWAIGALGLAGSAAAPAAHVTAPPVDAADPPAAMCSYQCGNYAHWPVPCRDTAQAAPSFQVCSGGCGLRDRRETAPWTCVACNDRDGWLDRYKTYTRWYGPISAAAAVKASCCDCGMYHVPVSRSGPSRCASCVKLIGQLPPAPGPLAKAIQKCGCGKTTSVAPQYPGWVCITCRANAGWLRHQVGAPIPVDPKTEITQEIPIPGFSLDLDTVAKDPDYPHVCPARDCGGKALIMSSSVECTKPGCRNFPKGGLKSWT